MVGVSCRLRVVRRFRGLLSASAAAMVIFLLSGSAGTVDRQSSSAQTLPKAWGVLSGNSGCGIFAESRKTNAKFVGVVIVKWHEMLDVLETRNYTIQRKQWGETREDLDELQKLALNNKLKLVKIPAKHSDQQLEAARSMCIETSLPGLPTSSEPGRSAE